MTNLSSSTFAPAHRQTGAVFKAGQNLSGHKGTEASPRFHPYRRLDCDSFELAVEHLPWDLRATWTGADRERRPAFSRRGTKMRSTTLVARAFFRCRAASRYELAVAGALLTCFAVVFNVGPFTRVAQQHVEVPERPAVETSWEQPIVSTSIGRQAGTTIHREAFHSDADRIKPLIDLSAVLMRWSSLSDVAFTRSGVQPVSINDGDREITPKPAPPEREPVDLVAPVHGVIVGIWAPDTSSCSVKGFREGSLPVVINTDGAWAGETFCIFKNQKQTKTDWRVVADCSNPRENWTSNVRLTVKGNRLTWTSKRGTQAYRRCAPDIVTAEAR
jgi:hypothetical protein